MPDDELNITELLADNTNGISEFLKDMFEITDGDAGVKVVTRARLSNLEDAAISNLFRDKWIVTVVSLRHTKKAIRKLYGSYRRTYILYNLETGHIIPCISTGKNDVKKRCDKYSSKLQKADKDGKDKFFLEEADPAKNYHILGTEGDKYYFNILYNELEADVKSSNKKKKQYISRSKLLNIQLETLLEKLAADTNKSLRAKIRKDYYEQMVQKSSIDETYKTISTNKNRIPSILKFQNSMIGIKGFKKLYSRSYDSYSGIKEGSASINKQKFSKLEDIIKESLLSKTDMVVYTDLHDLFAANGKLKTQPTS